MPFALLAALAGSFAIHLSALFGTEIDLSGPPEPVPLIAELKPAPPPQPVAGKPEGHARKPAGVRRAPKPAATISEPKPVLIENEAAAGTDAVEAAPVVDSAAISEPSASVTPDVLPVVPETPVQAVLPATGLIRYTVIKVPSGLIIGRAEHRWEFAGDGQYHLQAVTETTGLVALFRSARIEQESRGKLTANGLQPTTYRVRKNGRDNNENADFDWSTAQVTLSREDAPRPLSRGTQDLLSLHYQLAYLPKLETGAQLGVVTGKRYKSFALDALGEEEIETPAGRFRTLHLRVVSDDVTEFWIAPEQRGLPVKIRFTDRKGDSFEQLATEIGLLP